MRKSKDIFVQEFKTRPLDWIIRVVTIIILGLGAYITIKLVPVYQNITEITTEIKAMRSDIVELQSVSKSNQDIMIELKGLSTTMDDIKARIERIDTRLAKHMGI
jgi:anionic cell wall polymer biosynthesis LytR-Cps2A-Psr (LCP) family protein